MMALSNSQRYGKKVSDKWTIRSQATLKEAEGSTTRQSNLPLLHK